MPQRKLEQILLDAKILNPADLATAAADAVRAQTRLAWKLLDSGAVDPEQFARVVARGSGTELRLSLPEEVPPWVYRRIPPPIARQYRIVPLDISGNRLTVATLDPTDNDAFEVLAAVTGSTVEPVVAVKSALERLLDHIYPFEIDIDPTRISPAAGEDSEPGVRTIAVEQPAVVRHDRPRTSWSAASTRLKRWLRGK